MKKTITILTLAGLIALAACREESVPVYSGDSYVQFVKNLVTDSSTIAFLFAPGVTEIDSPLVVKRISAVFSAAEPYKIIVDRALTTAVEGTHFVLPAATAFAPGALFDTAWVKFLRAPDLKTASYRLVLRVEENENFKTGQWQYCYKTFWMNDKLTRPDWWTANVETSYLGAYSDYKFECFIEATGISDLSGADGSEIRSNALKFKYWLDEKRANGQTVLERNGDEMQVTVRG
jgi:hypothetical protein